MQFFHHRSQQPSYSLAFFFFFYPALMLQLLHQPAHLDVLKSSLKVSGEENRTFFLKNTVNISVHFLTLDRDVA